MSNPAPKKGFTLVELLVVISIIAILSVVGVTVFSGVQNKARDAKIKADFNAMYKNIEIARMAQQKPLGQITNNYCSDCINNGVECRNTDFSNPSNYATCLNTMTTSYGKVTKAPLPIDPWGDPYYIDENEGEGGVSCSRDSIRSAGPDRIGGTDDDKGFSIPLSGYTGCQ